MNWPAIGFWILWVGAVAFMVWFIAQHRRERTPKRAWISQRDRDRANRIELLHNLKKIVGQQSDTISELHKVVEKLQSQIKEALELYLQCEDERRDILTRVEKMEEAFAKTRG